MLGCRPMHLSFSMSKASKVVSSSLLGLDLETFQVNKKIYTVSPPTIKRLAGASYYLSKDEGGDNIGDALRIMFSESANAAKALSWLVAGDESLSDEFAQGTLEEVLTGLEKAMSLVGTANFPRLSALMRNVSMLTAKPK